jgi:hypothetical protein
MGALATAAVLSSTQVRVGSGDEANPRQRLTIAVVGFVAGVLEHGVLDYLPHLYPIPSGLDVLTSIALFIVAVSVTKPEFRVLVTACFMGSVLPDLVDLGPPILNHHLGWTLPTVKIFPWHWPQFSGSLYHGEKGLQSTLLHCAVIGVCVSLCWCYRHSLLAYGSESRR